MDIADIAPAIIIGALVLLLKYIYLFLFKIESKKSKDNKIQSQKEIPKGPFTIEEVAKHNRDTDCWIIVDNKVYDVTDYIDQHPGGDSILNNAGGDSSKGVHGPQHPATMWDVLAQYYIGDLIITQEDIPNEEEKLAQKQYCKTNS